MGVEGGATTPTTGCDAWLSPLCAKQPLALPPHCPGSQPVETPPTGWQAPHAADTAPAALPLGTKAS